MIKEIAEKIAFETSDNTASIDPATILAIIGVIVQIFRLYKECNKNAEKVKSSINSPGWLDRWRLKRMVRKAGLSNKVHESLLKKARETKMEEVEAMLAES